MKPTLMLLPTDLSKKLSPRFYGLGKRISQFFPDLEENLLATDLDMDAREYMGTSLANALFMGFFVSFIVLLAAYTQGKEPVMIILYMIGTFIAIFFSFLLLYAKYPAITAANKSEKIDMNLVFALKDVELQIVAGVDLYVAMQHVADANYGEVSIEFNKVVRKIEVGVPMIDALEEMAIKTKSSYLKRTVWQIINSIKSGSNLHATLKNIVRDLSAEQNSKIKNYARELNLWSLLYLLFAVAVPSIGSTMLVVLSSFAGFGLTKGTFIAFIALSIIIQIMLIGMIKSRRPMVDF